jgi:hypothetical protein
MLKNKPVLDLLYKKSAGEGVASFCDAPEELDQWQKILENVANADQKADTNEGMVDDDAEDCPRCGRRESITTLLTSGCSSCGWKSPRLKRQEVIA